MRQSWVLPAVFLGVLFSGVQGRAAATEGTLTAALDRTSAAVGDVVTLTLGFPLPEGSSLPDPPRVRGLEQLTVVGREFAPGQVRFRLLVDQLETLKTGALSLTLLDKDRQPVTLAAAPVELKITSNLGEKPAEAQLRPLQDIVPVRPPWLRYLPWVLGGLALALAAAGLYLWIKRRRGRLHVPDRAEPPHLWAAREIQRLEGQRLFEKGKVKEFYFGLSEILRRYLEAIRGFPAAEYTVEEIARHVRADADRQLLTLLRQADLVKFADDVPTPARKDEEVQLALAYVRDTAPLPESAPAAGVQPGGAR